MKRVFFVLFAVLLLLPVARLTMQDTTPPRIEITGVNPTQLPTITITANVFDRVGQPVFGLTADNFVITGDLADKAHIVKVENITDNNLSFSVVLAIDTSSSMAGPPIERAREAAIAFVNSISTNNPSVAIVSFASNERLVQDFTNDKSVLLSAINNLVYGGKTALYDGTLLAIQKAAESSTPRRAVVILSDGAEFGGRSSAGRGDALAQALKLGVPVYTIGLGYGIDRTYLKELADGTNGKNFESPSPEELLSIYQNLAATLRSQYVITAQVDVPGDGTTYNLGLQTTTADGSATAVADLRAPIAVPIVSLPGLPTEAITQATDITADVKADDAISTAAFQLNGTTVSNPTAPPYTITLDPLTLPPGSNSLTFSVTDANGDLGTVTQNFEVAALPSTVTVFGVPSGDISEPQSVTLDVTGQTPAVNATYSVDGSTGTVVTDAPYTFALDPYQFAPGPHTLGIDVTNEGGATAHVDAPFTVATLAPQISITGVDANQVISDPTTVTATITKNQSPITAIIIKVGDTALTGTSGATTSSATIDPMQLPPGKTTLTATANDQNSQTGTQTVQIEIAALPPQVTLSGLQTGETLEENRTVTVDTTSQTPVTDVTYSVDGKQIGSQSAAPFSVDLDILALGPGGHILSVDVTNASGQKATADAAFAIAEGPALTATATLWTSTPAPTNTPRPSNTPAPTSTSAPSNTPVAATDTPAPTVESALVSTSESPVATSSTDSSSPAATTKPVASSTPALSNTPAPTDTSAPTNTPAPTDTPKPTATATVNEVATAQSAATQSAAQTAAADMLEMMTQQAISAANSQATLDTQATTQAQVTDTADAQAALAAQSTKNSEETRSAEATRNAQSTQNAQATVNAQATTAAEKTAEPTVEATVETTVEPTEVAQVSTATGQATVAITPTGAATVTAANTTPEPTLTPIPLTAETQTVATNNNILPIAVICIVGLLVLLVVFLFAGRRRRSNIK